MSACEMLFTQAKLNVSELILYLVSVQDIVWD